MYVCMYCIVLVDPLSAVDAHVGQHLFDECVMSLKGQGKCVILVTNALKHVKHATYIVVLKDGKVSLYTYDCHICMYVCMIYVCILCMLCYVYFNVCRYICTYVGVSL